MASLSRELAALVAGGDVEGARAVSETIARLLEVKNETSGPTSAGAPVVDLAKERLRRGGR